MALFDGCIARIVMVKDIVGVVTLLLMVSVMLLIVFWAGDMRCVFYCWRSS